MAAMILHLSDGWIMTAISAVQLCSMLLQHVLPPTEDGEVTGASSFDRDGKEQDCDCTTSSSINIFLQKQGRVLYALKA